jgi:hypothetical protein
MISRFSGGFCALLNTYAGVPSVTKQAERLLLAYNWAPDRYSCEEINGGATIGSTLLTQLLNMARALVEQRRFVAGRVAAANSL